MQFILDASLTMTWCFEDEKDDYADKVLHLFQDENVKAIVPSLWCLEIVNILRSAERRKRISYSDQTRFISFLKNLPIIVSDGYPDMNHLLSITQKFDLTAYDAAYLHLALNLNLPIATLDKQLSKAAQDAEVNCFLNVSEMKG